VTFPADGQRFWATLALGGNLPLGYDRPTDLANRSLTVNLEEAKTVRLILQRYLALGSVSLLERWLHDEGIRSKARVSTRGRAMGGLRFSRGALFHLLKSRVYLGEIPHILPERPPRHHRDCVVRCRSGDAR
jgi:site-specific DNA recombinase